jgi:hypothetical protein
MNKKYLLVSNVLYPHLYYLCAYLTGKIFNFR